MNNPSWLCSVCQTLPATFFCCCNQLETLLCSSCISLHHSKAPDRLHSCLSIAAYGQHTIPGYYDRFQVRSAAISRNKAELNKNVSVVEGCVMELRKKVKDYVDTVWYLTGQTIDMLESMKADIQNEVELAIAEAEKTVYLDTLDSQNLLVHMLRNAETQQQELSMFRYQVQDEALTVSMGKIVRYERGIKTEQMIPADYQYFSNYQTASFYPVQSMPALSRGNTQVWTCAYCAYQHNQHAYRYCVNCNMIRDMLRRAMGVWMKPKYYADVCVDKGPSYYEYEKLKITWGPQLNYRINEKLGKGKYSDVHVGVNLKTGQKVVIKILKPVRTHKIQREIAVLHALRSGPNIVQLLDVIKEISSGQPALVLEFIENTDFRELYPTLSDFEVRYYLFEILKTLDFTHSRGIMHRDIKPLNIMIDHKKRDLKVIDWGMAEFYVPGKEYHVRVASRYFKAPEFLSGNTQYEYSCDIWSLGALFAGILFRSEPFFNGSDNIDQLIKISRVLGSVPLHRFLSKFKLTLEPQFYDGGLGYFPQKPWSRFVNSANKDRVNTDALDLLDRMLRYDYTERITPKEAITHEYFRPVVDMWSKIATKSLISESSPAYPTATAILSRSQSSD